MPQRALHRAFRLSVRVVHTCVHPSKNQVKGFAQGRISRPINGSKLIFRMRMYLYETSRNMQEPWPHDLYFMVHCSGGARWLSGRVSDSGARGPGFETYRRRVVSLSKTLYSPKVLVNYPGWLRPDMTEKSMVESQDLLMVASCYFTWGCISMRSAGIHKNHDLLTYISRSADCKLWSIFHGEDFCHG